MHRKILTMSLLFLMSGCALVSAQDFMNFPGTRIYLRMPAGYRLAPYTNRFVGKDGGIVTAVENPGNVTEEIARLAAAYKSGSPEALGKITSLERQEAGTIYLEYEDGESGFAKAYRLITGNGQTVSSVTALLPLDAGAQTVESLKTCVETAKWNKGMPVSFSGLMYFGVDQKKFSIGGYSGCCFSFQYSGKKKDPADQVGGIIASAALDAPVPPDQFEAEAASIALDPAVARADMTSWESAPITQRGLEGVRISFGYDSPSGPVAGRIYAFFKPDRIFYLKGETRAGDNDYYAALLDDFFSGYRLK
jgi:hypothetical protein